MVAYGKPGAPRSSAIASVVARNDSVTITAVGTPAASNTTPSAAAAALQEPQSPTPVTITSAAAAISLMTSSASGMAKFFFVRSVRLATP